jgi:hypothetical protein
MVNMVNSVTPVTYQRCGSNYPAPSSRNGELNAEGNSHAQTPAESSKQAFNVLDADHGGGKRR